MAISEVFIALQLIDQNNTLNPEAIETAHKEPRIETLVHTLRSHFAELDSSIEDPDSFTDALLLLVHGAVFMASSTSLSSKSQIHIKLTKSVWFLIGNNSSVHKSG